MRKFCLLLLAVMLPCSLTLAMQAEDRAGNYGRFPDGADSSSPDGFLCEECRDFVEYPMDAAAFAYNGYFGDIRWMPEAGLGMPFRIYGLDGSWVLVWFEGVLFDVPTLLPDLMDVMVRMPDGRVLTFTVLQHGPDLPVGGPVADPVCVPGTTGNGGGGNDDDYEEPDEYDEIEFDDPVGRVDIVDPDEDGNFPDWLEEL